MSGMELDGIACESAGLLELNADDKVPGLFKDVILVREGWGHSGYYDGDVLHRDGPTSFPVGTRIFLNHAEGEFEKADAVMGVMASEARAATDADGKRVLKGDIQIFKTGVHNHEWAMERAKAKAIELSIRCPVKYAQGTREGKYGKVVSAMGQAYSVDVVARGGAGGSFGTIQESAPNPGLVNDEKEGSEMLTAEESAAIGKSMADALTPMFANITTALGDLKTAVVTESKPVALKTSEIVDKLTKAKLSEKAVTRVFTALEAEGIVATAAVVDSEIGREVSIAEEAAAAVKAALEEGDANFEEGAPTDGSADKGYKPGGVRAWGVATEAKKVEAK